MRSEQLLIVLLAAVAAGRPVPAPHDGQIVPRELQYADIAAAYARHAPGPHDDAKARRELQYADIIALSGRVVPTSHDNVNVHRELEYSEIVALSGPPPKWNHGSKHHAREGHHFWDGHHARDGHDHFDRTFVSLLREARSDVPARVLEGVKTFLSHVVRDIPEQPEHEHEAEHPRGSVVDNILEFLSKATR